MRAARSKYGAKKTVVNGISFDSRAEAARYVELVALQDKGRIETLEVQPAYVLAPAVVLDGRKKPALRYRADFRYRDADSGRIVIEDVKGHITDVYRMKRHLMKSVLDLDIVEIRER